MFLSMAKLSKILFIITDSHQASWSAGAASGYAIFYGMKEGLEANGHSCDVILPAWVPYLDKLFPGNQYDQIWFYGPTTLDETTLASLSERVSTRVCFVTESLYVNPVELKLNPVGTKLKTDGIERAIKYATHLIVADEHEIAVAKALQKPCLWFDAEQIICTRHRPETMGWEKVKRKAIFSGTPYGKRREYLQHPDLRDLIETPLPREIFTQIPALYDQTKALERHYLANPGLIESESYSRIVNNYILTRDAVARMVIDKIRNYACYAALPNLTTKHNLGVAKSIIAGRPVILRYIEGRPLTNAFYKAGEEALYYQEDNVQELAAGIRMLSNDLALANHMVNCAREKLYKHNTLERFVWRTLRWVDTGIDTLPSEDEYPVFHNQLKSLSYAEIAGAMRQRVCALSRKSKYRPAPLPYAVISIFATQIIRRNPLTYHPAAVRVINALRGY